MKKLLVIYRITVDARHEEFEAEYKQYKPTQETIPGHYSEILVRSIKDPSAYVIVSTWDPESFETWIQSPSHGAVVQILNKYKRGAPRVSKYLIQQNFERPLQASTAF